MFDIKVITIYELLSFRQCYYCFLALFFFLKNTITEYSHFFRESIVNEIKTRFKNIKGHNNDDGIDRLSHVYTTVLFVVIALIVTTAHFVGKNIHCWIPAELNKDHYQHYLENYCWISNTYLVEFHEELPKDIPNRIEREITYYQWVPVLLLFQAFLFKVPNVIWRLFHSHGGVSLHNIVELAEKTQATPPKDRKATIETLASIIDHWLMTERPWKDNRYTRARSKMSERCSFMFSKRSGNYLAGMYLIVKLLYFANVVGQFFILNEFMATDYSVYGFEFLEKMRDGKPWRNSPRFPLVTFCDFDVRQLQNVLRYTIQCVLPINLFNEKFYVFLWFWFFIVALLSGISLLKFLITTCDNNSRSRFVKKYLAIDGHIQDKNSFDKKLSKRFADHYLREDGIFVLRVITMNSTDLVTCDLVSELWRNTRRATNRMPRGIRRAHTHK